MTNEWDLRLMGLAGHIASWSKDPSTKVGAVISDSKHRILGVGYNGFPRGVPDGRCALHDRKTKLHCTVHAEANAIQNSARTEGCTLHVTLFPCSHCAGLIIQAGIVRVCAPPMGPDRWLEGQTWADTMMRAAGVEISCVSST